MRCAAKVVAEAKIKKEEKTGREGKGEEGYGRALPFTGFKLLRKKLC